jgi:hypothetical protein
MFVMELQLDESARPNPVAIQNQKKPARRFRIVKLEERVAPSQFGNANGAPHSVHHTQTCLCYRSASGH